MDNYKYIKIYWYTPCYDSNYEYWSISSILSDEEIVNICNNRINNLIKSDIDAWLWTVKDEFFEDFYSLRNRSYGEVSFVTRENWLEHNGKEW